jgi:hypothetical protein
MPISVPFGYGPDLREHAPIVVTEHVDEEDPGGSDGLTNGFGLPFLLDFDVKEVVADLVLDQRRRVALEILVEQAHVPVIGMGGAVAIVAQREELGELVHRRIRVIIVHRIAVSPAAVHRRRRHTLACW